MKTDINPAIFSYEKPGTSKISKNIGNTVIKYFTFGVLALLAVGIFTSSQEVNAG